MTGVSSSPASSLEGVSPTLAYYAGSSARGTALNGAPTAAGTYTVVATFAGSADYTPASAQATFAITPAKLTVTANNATRVYGAANPTFTDTITGFVTGDTLASLTTPPTVTTTATTASPAGSYAITASGAVDPNYTISYVAGTLTISPDATTTTAGASARAPASASRSRSAPPSPPMPRAPARRPAPSISSTRRPAMTWAVWRSRRQCHIERLEPAGRHQLDQGFLHLYRGRQLPGQQREHQLDHDQPVDHRARPVGRRSAPPLGKCEHQAHRRCIRRLQLIDGSVRQRQRRGQSVGDRRAWRRSKERQCELQPHADHRGRGGCRPAASLAEPSTSGLTNYGSESLSGNSSATIKPGIYSRITVSGNGTPHD